MKWLDKNKVPYSTIVFSGNKSLHCIISLETPLEYSEDYRSLVEDIYFVIDPDSKKIDKSCKNPSRFTRNAEVIRPDKGIIQSLCRVTSRKSLGEVLAWIQKHPNYPKLHKRTTSIKSSEYFRKTMPKAISTHDKNKTSSMSRRAEAFFTYGVSPGQQWRQEAWYACSEAARCGFELAEIYTMLEQVDGYLNPDSTRIPEEAYNKSLTCGEFGIKLNITKTIGDK